MVLLAFIGVGGEEEGEEEEEEEEEEVGVSNQFVQKLHSALLTPTNLPTTHTFPKVHPFR